MPLSSKKQLTRLIVEDPQNNSPMYLRPISRNYYLGGQQVVLVLPGPVHALSRHDFVIDTNPESASTATTFPTDSDYMPTPCTDYSGDECDISSDDEEARDEETTGVTGLDTQVVRGLSGMEELDAVVEVLPVDIVNIDPASLDMVAVVEDSATINANNNNNNNKITAFGIIKTMIKTTAETVLGLGTLMAMITLIVKCFCSE